MRPCDDARPGADAAGWGPAPVGKARRGFLQRHGGAHEALQLARLRAAGRSVVEIVREGVSLMQSARCTLTALERGAEVMFQGAHVGGVCGGAICPNGSSGRRAALLGSIQGCCLCLNLRLPKLS
jgi:hypothetical protein